MNMPFKILVINPGSTSTKVAAYLDKEQIWAENISHSLETFAQYAEIYDQLEERTRLVIEAYEKHGNKAKDFDAVAARGGLMPPVHTGAYKVTQYMIDYMHYRPLNKHASNLGAAIAYKIAQEAGVDAYIYDAIAVDEMEDIYRITGLKSAPRNGRGHNLNMRGVVINFCEEQEIDYRQQNIISVHLGGGISVGLISKGRIVDTIADDEGPFSPERAGGLPVFKVIDLCYDVYPNKDFAKKSITNNAGLMEHLGTKDLREVENMIANGDKHAELIFDAMALNISKNIAKLAVDVNGKIDRIILTGGMAYSERLVNEIKKRCEWIAPVKQIPGEKEMDALAHGTLRVLIGEETADILTEET